MDLNDFVELYKNGRTIKECICVFKGNVFKPTAVKHYDTFAKRLSNVFARCL